MTNSTIYLIIIHLLLTVACNQPTTQTTNNSKTDAYTLKQNTYAKGFEIQTATNETLLRIKNPWQGASEQYFSYILTQTGTNNSIKVPIKKAVCMSTGHIGMLDKLSEINSIIGISGNYIFNKTLRNKFNSGEIVDVGYETAINYELLLSIKPDVVFLYGVGQEVMSVVKKLDELNIQVVLIAEYLEASPLASAEWLKFFGAFYGKSELADSLFTSIEQRYMNIKKQASHIGTKPTVFSGLPWNDVWYVPGGKSFAAQYIADAGGTYIWANDNSNEALPLSLEVVLAKAANADIWINPGAATSLNFILNADSRMENFSALRNVSVFNNNNRVSPNGGNDYWESGLISPDVILGDMLKIVHPELDSTNKIFYYKALK